MKKIFAALLLSFGCLFAEHNLTKEMINKEMIKQITTPDEILFSKGYEEFCSELVNDLKTGKDIEVLTPMNKEEIEEARAKVENLPKLPEGNPMNALHNAILGIDIENEGRKERTKTMLYKLWDNKYLREVEVRVNRISEPGYGITVVDTTSTGEDLGNFHDTFTYPHYSIRFNAMHKPIKYKDKYYVIRTWKSFDHLWVSRLTELLLEPEKANKDKILFTMTLFDLQTNRTAACRVAKRINRRK